MYPYQGGWEGSLLKNQSKGTYSTRMGLGPGASRRGVALGVQRFAPLFAQI